MQGLLLGEMMHTRLCKPTPQRLHLRASAAGGASVLRDRGSSGRVLAR